MTELFKKGKIQMKIFKGIFFLFLCFLTTTLFAYTYKELYPLEPLFQSAISEHAFPGGCLIAGTKNHIFVEQCYGYHSYEKKIPDQLTDIFDLASLTKVIATTSAIMKLYEQGKIRLDDPVVKYLPNFIGPTAEQTKLKSLITIRDLLTHSSGLPPDHLVDRLSLPNIQDRWQVTLQTPVIHYRHRYTIYSDINFELLGKIVEKISGLSLDQFTEKYIFKPLGMDTTMFNPPERYRDRIIPTVSRDGVLIAGRVHDEVAASLGGVAGHAGLFSTIDDLRKFAQMLLNGGCYHSVCVFKSSTIRVFTTRANLVLNSSRALGWDTAYNPHAALPLELRSSFLSAYAVEKLYAPLHNFTAGLYIDADAFGHSGYTGTSIWVSPKNDIFVIFLTNRVLPCKDQLISLGEKYWRQTISTAIWGNLGFTKKNPLFIEPYREDVCAATKN